MPWLTFSKLVRVILPEDDETYVLRVNNAIGEITTAMANPSCCVHADQSPLDMVSDSIQRCTVRCAAPSPDGLGQLSQHRSVDVSASTVTMIGTTPRS